jgi:hypothetical protein
VERPSIERFGEKQYSDGVQSRPPAKVTRGGGIRRSSFPCAILKGRVISAVLDAINAAEELDVRIMCVSFHAEKVFWIWL